MNLENIRRLLFTCAGAIITALAPTGPYVALCTVAVLGDCLSAYLLARRARRIYPRLANPDAAKFKSHDFGDTVVTLMLVYALLIFAFYTHIYITSSLPFNALKLSAGAVIAWQGWSILENASSCNGARWAQILQRVMVDKTARHLEIDSNELEDILKGRRPGNIQQQGSDVSGHREPQNKNQDEDIDR